jgi:two-component system, chemotaxis family, CheB/CheR fusion protein
MTETDTQAFENLLQMLKHNRGFDFTGYKRSTLMRRVQKRMHTIGITDYERYKEYLEVNADEFDILFNTILINVTSFLRDPEAWDALNEIVIKPLSARTDARQIRVWSAGCASGQETYTLLMMLADAVGIVRFKKQVKVYATDADNEALMQARNATYSAREIEELPEKWRTTYFEPASTGFVFRNDLRRCVIFGEHDLVQDAPISRLDLLVCRNTLIYFNADTQSRILARFHFALNDEAHMFLGKSEMLLTHSRLFNAVDVRSRIFRKIGRGNLRDRLLVLAQSGNSEAGEAGLATANDYTLRDASFESGPAAQYIVDKAGTLVLANEMARALFRLGRHDIGRPIQDLELSYRPLEIRSLIEEAYATRTPRLALDIEFKVGAADTRYFDVRITPLVDERAEYVGASIIYTDVTHRHYLAADLMRSTQERETANEELQATNEELETTNEELQSAIEELETTNEELQSTNEELETMNEELQSTNEEMETINEELRRRSTEVGLLNETLEAIMSSFNQGVAVTDSDMNITLWNQKAADLWGLRSDEVEGKSLLALDIGLPIADLARPMHDCLAGSADFKMRVLNATNRRGKAIKCRVGCTRLTNMQNEPCGLILFMEEWDETAGQK